jgi:adenine phosphoribosyltransferase
VLVHDDLIATGGTSLAVVDLIKHFNIRSIFINFIVELSFLNGREKFPPEYDIYSLIKF